MAEHHYDLIIAGTGPAGLTAAIYAQRMGLKVVVFGDTPGGNLYMIENIMNYPGFIGGISGTQLGTAAFAQAQQEGVTLTMTALGRLSMDQGQFVGVDTNAGRYSAPTALVATGRKPRVLDVPNAHKNGICFCSLCDGPLFRDKHATLAVIGGDSMAGHHALQLAKIADRVILISRKARLEMEAVIANAVNSKSNIDLLLETEVVAFSSADDPDADIDGVIVQTKAGQKKEIALDAVFMAVGWHPNLDLLDIDAATTGDGYLKTDAKLMTSVAGLFAAGDVRDTDMWQVVTACADGARAAKYAADFIEQCTARR